MANKKKKKKQSGILRLIRMLLVVLVLCLAGLGGYLILTSGVPDQADMQIVIDTGKILANTTINGVNVFNMTPVDARAAIDDQVQIAASSIAVKLQFPDGRTEMWQGASVGVYPNADDTIWKAMEAGRSGDISQRKQAIANPPTQVLTLGFCYNAATLDQTIRAAIPSLNVAPTEPTVSIGANGKLIFGSDGKPVINQGKAGINLDVDKFVSLVKTAVTNGTFGPIIVPGTAVHPTVNTDQLVANTQLVSQKMTTYTDASNSGRAMNIKKMVGILSGHIVMPGQTFSVNGIAGDRTLAAGWYLANGIENGAFTPQPGGGICQVSTTLYNAALMADLDVTERTPHSIPSHYVDKAQDATVSSGGQDLKFINTSDSPVYVILYTDESKGAAQGITKNLYAEIWGKPLPTGQTIKLRSVKVSETPYSMTDANIVSDPALVHGGYNGYVYNLFKDYYINGKLDHSVKENTSVYKMIKPSVLPATPSPSPTVSPAPSP
jgi:hypothetical protein